MADLERLKELWATTLSLRAIGKELGITGQRVHQLGKAHQLGERPPKPSVSRKVPVTFVCSFCSKTVPLRPSLARGKKYCSVSCTNKAHRIHPVPESIRNMPRTTPEERRAATTAYTLWLYTNVPKHQQKRREWQRTEKAREYHRLWLRRKLEQDPDYYRRRNRKMLENETPEKRERRLASYRRYAAQRREKKAQK